MRFPVFLFSLFCIASSPGAAADENAKPLWELGIGVTALQSPQYRGDRRDEIQYIPFPSMIYRGKNLNIDRDGIQGLLFKSESVKINISGNAATAVRSDDTALRQGMRDLDASLEFGPALEFYLLRDQIDLGLSFTFRAALATDFRSLKHIGWTSNPHFFYMNDHFIAPFHRLSIATGPVFADERFHRYYFDVEARDVNASRQEYTAGAGYGGWRSTISLSRYLTPQFWIAGFVRHDSLHHARYSDSPLVGKNSFMIIGMVATYRFWYSNARVD